MCSAKRGGGINHALEDILRSTVPSTLLGQSSAAESQTADARYRFNEMSRSRTCYSSGPSPSTGHSCLMEVMAEEFFQV